MLGAHIRKLRKYRGITVKDLAVKAGISRSILYRFEGGRQNISISTLEEILYHLNGRIYVLDNELL